MPSVAVIGFKITATTATTATAPPVFRALGRAGWGCGCGHENMSPLRVGCSKQTSKTYAFFAYSFTSFDNQIRGKVDISPFFDMAMPTCFQSFFEIEINSSDFISKMKT